EIPVKLVRHRCQVTEVSLFAFISDLCANRQMAGRGTGGRARTGGLDEEVAAPGATPAPGIAVAAEVSLAVAAKASGENFPVALRVLPGQWRAHLTAPDGLARLTHDIRDEPPPGPPPAPSPGTVTGPPPQLPARRQRA